MDVGTTGVRWATYVPQTGRVEPNRQGGGGVVAALPADQAVFRLVEMPPLPARERKDALRWELQRILPLPVDEAVYDWVELPTVDGEASREPGGGRPSAPVAPAPRNPCGTPSAERRSRRSTSGWMLSDAAGSAPRSSSRSG